MKTLCLLESVSRLDGGIFEAESAFQKHLHGNEGVEVQVVGLEDRFTREDASRWAPLLPRALPVKGPRALGYSAEFTATLDPQADLLYAATLWRYPSWAALRWAEQTGKPMIVAPHGSLDSWALQHSAWRKRLAAWLFKDQQFHAASCLRALSITEADSIRAYGLKNPICIIPNGIELPDLSESRVEGRGSRATEDSEDGSMLSMHDSRRPAQKTLLFLGRLHPKKGLLNAIRAFANALDSRPSTLDSSWSFVIAGWDQGGHESELKKLCDDLGLSWTDRRDHEQDPISAFSFSTLDFPVVFTGPIFGEEKKSQFRSASAFILPSLSEGLPMAVLEAWACGLPVLMTPECHLPEGFQADAAIRIEAEVRSIAQGMQALFSMTEAERAAMGKRGRRLVELRFDWKILAREMREVYDWVLGGGSAPSCVRC